MGKTLVLLQPSYCPWIGAFAQMDQSDVFVIFDDAQYTKNDWRNRNRIKTAQGIQWLTVPVFKNGFPLIKDVLIDNSDNWAIKHLKSIKQNYSRSPYYKDYIGIFEEIYYWKWEYLLDLDMALILKVKEALGITADIDHSSNLDLKGNRIEKLIDCCVKIGATEFLEGHAGKGYLQGEGETLFKEAGINLVYQDYKHPVYPQLYGEFVSHLSVIDLLFNCGKESLNVIRSGS
jgi:hypothetical protein